MAQNGCQKIVDFIDTKISPISKAIEEGSIEVIRLFLKVASTEDKDSMNELIKTLLSTDQVAREYFEKNDVGHYCFKCYRTYPSRVKFP